MSNFRELLDTPNSCARKTLASLLVKSQKASNFEEAELLMRTYPGFDMLEIFPFVRAGLNSFSVQLQVPVKSLIEEENLSCLKNASAIQILNALEAIHQCWIDKNLTPMNWVDKYFNDGLFIFLPGKYQSFEDIKTNMLFIENYLLKADCYFAIPELEELIFESRSQKNLDSAKAFLIDWAYDNQKSIADSVISFKTQTKDPGLSERIEIFFRDTRMAPSGIVSKMITDAIKNF